MKTPYTLAEKLKNYSLLAGSVLASSATAQAQVVYTDVIPDKQLGGVVPSSYPDVMVDTLDLNNDGLYDFKITLANYAKDTVLEGFTFREKIDGGFNSGNSILYYPIEPYNPIVLKFKAGDSIPGNEFFLALPLANFASQKGLNFVDNWKDEHDQYVALKFMIGSDRHFGWVRLDVNTMDTIPNIIIKDFAYQKTPDAKIAAGDTGIPLGINVPENQQQLSIYPNPSSGNCVIEFKQSLTGEMTLSVKDALGRNVYETNVRLSGNRKELPFDFSRFDPGMYFITLTSEAFSLTEKWMKN